MRKREMHFTLAIRVFTPGGEVTSTFNGTVDVWPFSTRAWVHRDLVNQVLADHRKCGTRVTGWAPVQFELADNKL